jgi:hypothetical protein
MTAIASLIVVVLVASEAWRMQGDTIVRSSTSEGASPTLEDAQRSFYSGRYEDAAALPWVGARRVRPTTSKPASCKRQVCTSRFGERWAILRTANARGSATRARLSRRSRADQILECSPRREVMEHHQNEAAIVLALSTERAQASSRLLS